MLGNKHQLSPILKALYFWLPSKCRGLVVKAIINLEGGWMYSRTIRAIYSEDRGVRIGYGSYGGCFSSSIPSGVTFGNYCSVAQEIRIFRANHPKGSFTSHPILYNPTAEYVKHDMLSRPPLTIGHDVWIGEWVMILPSVMHIGNGAMIGAGSIVTKDVVAYSVVAGNPARLIGKRFDNGTINNLEETRWWEFDKHDLVHRIEELNQIAGFAGFRTCGAVLKWTLPKVQ